MIRTLLLYKIIDLCLDSFFDDLDVKLTPLTDIYSDAMLVHDLKWVVTRSELKCIDIYRGSLTILLLARSIIVKRKMNMRYESILVDRIFRYFDDRYAMGDTRFCNAIIMKMSMRVVVSPTKIHQLVSIKELNVSPPPTGKNK